MVKIYALEYLNGGYDYDDSEFLGIFNDREAIIKLITSLGFKKRDEMNFEREYVDNHLGKRVDHVEIHEYNLNEIKKEELHTYNYELFHKRGNLMEVPEQFKEAVIVGYDDAEYKHPFKIGDVVEFVEKLDKDHYIFVNPNTEEREILAKVEFEWLK